MVKELLYDGPPTDASIVSEGYVVMERRLRNVLEALKWGFF